MCGISGIVSKTNRLVPEQRIRKINDLIRHRGPDGEGYFFGGNFAFGHRRLAILDLSERGRQPMCYQDRYWITYNGEVYNYLEIRQNLTRKGYSFVTGTDTEVVLAAYAEWGAECLTRFNGMWAFAIYDALTERLFMARDRFGIKPLYYMQTGDEFAFGSELKQLVALQSAVRANRKIVVEGLLTHYHGHSSETYFAGLSEFPQGHYALYDLRGHTFELHRYYGLSADSEITALNSNDATHRFLELLEDSIRLRLRSDVRVGTCLSGGLDSASVSGIASRLFHEKSTDQFLGIHAKSIDAEVDESHYARRVADHFGLDCHIVEPGIQDFVQTVDEVVYTQEEPFGSPSMFMGWYVFREANALGCKVMLNGQGGDEALLGYERYFAAYLRSLSAWGFLREIFSQSLTSRRRLCRLPMVYLYFTNPDVRIWLMKRRSVLRAEVKDHHDFDTIRQSTKSFRDITDMQIHEVTKLQLPHLLRYEDRSSMRHSIETRLPFLDFRLVEFCVSLQSDMKIHAGWTKYVLRQAVDGLLPEEVTWRRDKLGFEAPRRSWLNAHADRMREEVASSRILAELSDLRALVEAYPRLSLTEQWTYFNLATWERVFSVGW